MNFRTTQFFLGSIRDVSIKMLKNDCSKKKDHFWNPWNESKNFAFAQISLHDH